MTVAVLTNILRRFDQHSSPFWPTFFAVLTNILRRFDQWLSPFWRVVVAVLTNACCRFDHCCRHFDVSPFMLSPFRLVAVMTGTQSSGVSRVGLRGVSKTRTFKWLVKVGASIVSTPWLKTNLGRRGVSGQPKKPGYATAVSPRPDLRLEQMEKGTRYLKRYQGPFKCYVMLFSWKFDPRPRNANNVGQRQSLKVKLKGYPVPQNSCISPRMGCLVFEWSEPTSILELGLAGIITSLYCRTIETWLEKLRPPPRARPGRATVKRGEIDGIWQFLTNFFRCRNAIFLNTCSIEQITLHAHHVSLLGGKYYILFFENPSNSPRLSGWDWRVSINIRISI